MAGRFITNGVAPLAAEPLLWHAYDAGGMAPEDHHTMAHRTELVGADPRLQQALDLACQDISADRPGVKPEDCTVVRRWTTLLNRVFEIEVAGGSDRLTLFVKLADSGAGSGLAHEAANGALFQGYFRRAGPRFGVVEVIGHYPQPDALVVVGCRGRCLLEAMRDTCGWRPPGPEAETTRQMARSLGEWVRCLEDESAGAADAGEVRRRLIGDSGRAVEKLAKAGAPTPKGLVATCWRAVKQIDDAPDSQVCMAHGDLHPGNVFVGDSGDRPVTAIDLRLARPCFVGYDALYFHHQLIHSFGPARFRPREIRAVIDAFRAGYGRALDGTSPIVRAIRAHLVLASLVYLATLADGGSPMRRLLCRTDGWRLARQLRRSFAGP